MTHERMHILHASCSQLNIQHVAKGAEKTSNSNRMLQTLRQTLHKWQKEEEQRTGWRQGKGGPDVGQTAAVAQACMAGRLLACT